MADHLRNTNGDEQKTPREREIRRNCGQLLGGLDAVLPCIYLAEQGVSGRDMRTRMSDTASGLFAVGRSVGSGVAPHLGLFLPVDLCRDEQIRAALLKIPPLITGAAKVPVSDKRRLAQSCLDEAFGGDLELADRATLDGFFEMTPTASFFRRLHEAFDYITEVIDNPAGRVRVTQTEPFPWRSYGELMEWRSLNAANRFDHWSRFKPFFVCGDTETADLMTLLWAPRGLTRPDEHPSQWFVIRPDLTDARPVVRLEMGRNGGWTTLHLGLDETSVTLNLSDVYDPFPDLIAWAREIDEGDLPVEMEIDEEGTEAVLTVLATDDPERVLLRVLRKYEDTILLAGIVARAALAEALKTELRRFFTLEFDPEEWTSSSDSQGEELKAVVLVNPWLAADD